jgi:hypothetical protein
MHFVFICRYSFCFHKLWTKEELSRTMAQTVIRRPFTTEARINARVSHVGCAANKVALGQVYFRLPSVFLCQYHYIVVLHTHISPAEGFLKLWYAYHQWYASHCSMVHGVSKNNQTVKKYK